jgi:4-amino-4-deoxy-L-arabinose transferase-like glycosyltransferase
MNNPDRAKRIRLFLSEIKEQPLVLIILLSVLLRLAVSFYMRNEVVELPGIFDQLSYHNLALRFLDGHGFTFGELWWPITRAGEPTAHWSFLYTLYLVGVYAIFGPHPVFARIIQSLIVGVLHPYITYRIGEKAFDRNVGLIAAAITAFYIYFIYYGAAIMTEPFYITFILFSLFFAMQLGEHQGKKKSLAFGLALGVSIGLTVTLRQVFLLFIPFLFAWIWFVRFKRTRSFPISSSAVSFIVIALFILPITFYNYSRFHRFVLLNTNSGYAFFWGNNPIYGTKFIPILSTSVYRAMIPKEISHLDEAALDSELLRRGIQFVVQDPKRFILLSLSRIPSYFMFWYSSSSSLLSNFSRIGSFGITLPFMLYGLFLAVRRSKSLLALVLSSQGLLILFVLVYSGIHILTWTLIRYRLPVDSVLILFAGLAITDIAQRLTVRFPVIQQLIAEGKQI